MATKQDILNDPNFKQLPPEEQTRVMGKYFPGEQFSPTAAAQPSPTSRFLSGVGESLNPMPVVHLAGKVYQAAKNPTGENLKAAGSAMYGSYVKPQVDEFSKALDYLKAGDPLTAAAYTVYGLIPAVGPAIAHGAEKMAAGDVAGGAGTWLGAAGPALLGASPKTAGGVVRAGLRKVLPELPEKYYKGAVPPPTGMPRAWQESMVREGLETGTLPTEKGAAAAGRRAAAGSARMDAITDPATATGQTPVPIADTVAPVNEMIRSIGRSHRPGAADALVKLRDEFVARHPSGSITVAEAQQLKRNADLIIKNSVYDVGAQPSGQALYDKLQRRGFRESIEKALPGLNVDVINKKTKANIDLAAAIETQLRKHPTFLHAYTPWILGTAAGTAAGRLIGGSWGTAAAGAGSALAAVLAKEAMHSPVVLARLAIALNRKGITLPISKAGAVYSGATLGPAMASTQAGQPTTAPPPADHRYKNPYE